MSAFTVNELCPSILESCELYAGWAFFHDEEFRAKYTDKDRRLPHLIEAGRIPYMEEMTQYKYFGVSVLKEWTSEQDKQWIEEDWRTLKTISEGINIKG